MKTLMTELQLSLNSDERVVWHAHPDPVAHAVGSLPLFLFGVPWMAFCLVWEYLAICGTYASAAQGINVAFGAVFCLWGMPFIAVGLTMITSPITAALTAKRTLYAITNKRVLELKAVGKYNSLKVFMPDEISRVETMRLWSFANVFFVHGRDSDGDRTSTGFYGIAESRVESAVAALDALRSKRKH
jgi:hypothetical protein